jgi:hypothetical protein
MRLSSVELRLNAFTLDLLLRCFDALSPDL